MTKSRTKDILEEEVKQEEIVKETKKEEVKQEEICKESDKEVKTYCVDSEDPKCKEAIIDNLNGMINVLNCFEDKESQVAISKIKVAINLLSQPEKKK